MTGKDDIVVRSIRRYRIVGVHKKNPESIIIIFNYVMNPTQIFR